MDLPRRLGNPGPIIEYLNGLQQHGGANGLRKAKDVVLAVRDTLNTPQGRILMDLLEKSTLETVMPVSADNSALAARNAQSFIALDLRRILSDEYDAVLEAKSPDVGTGRRGRSGG